MSELKPEDVMRALECCKGGGNACLDCVYFYRAVDTSCAPFLIKDALALLREKDAEIKGLVDGWSKDQDRFEKQLAEKNAEIERLRSVNDMLNDQIVARDEIAKTIRAEAIAEFVELAIKRICEKVVAPTPSESYIVEKCNQIVYETEKELKGVAK